MDRGTYAKDVDEYNKRNKADIKLRKCLKCIYFNKEVYMCKEKECIYKQ